MSAIFETSLTMSTLIMRERLVLKTP
jgi:hypothetical protein